MVSLLPARLYLYEDITMIVQVESFEKWVHDSKFKIMRPNTMNQYSAVLDDFGLETMLDKLTDDFIRPISRGNVLSPVKGFSFKF